MVNTILIVEKYEVNQSVHLKKSVTDSGKYIITVYVL